MKTPQRCLIQLKIKTAVLLRARKRLRYKSCFYLFLTSESIKLTETIRNLQLEKENFIHEENSLRQELEASAKTVKKNQVCVC
jgi:hypothetical protein